VALELATSGLLDPATSLLLAAAVHEARAGGAGGAGGPPLRPAERAPSEERGD